jgi:hypothetical protein
MWPRSRVRIPEQTVLVARAAFPNGSVAMSARDHLGEVFNDEQFAAAFGVCGAPAESPGALALVTALQFTENPSDRQAAQMVARACGCRKTRPSLWPGHSSRTMIELCASFERVQESQLET